jgi:hypothetical protein
MKEEPIAIQIKSQQFLGANGELIQGLSEGDI